MHMYIPVPFVPVTTYLVKHKYSLGEIRSGWCYSTRIVGPRNIQHYIFVLCTHFVVVYRCTQQQNAHTSCHNICRICLSLVWRFGEASGAPEIPAPKDTDSLTLCPWHITYICLVRKFVPEGTTTHLNNSLLPGCREGCTASISG